MMSPEEKERKRKTEVGALLALLLMAYNDPTVSREMFNFFRDDVRVFGREWYTEGRIAASTGPSPDLSNSEEIFLEDWSDNQDTYARAFEEAVDVSAKAREELVSMKRSLDLAVKAKTITQDEADQQIFDFSGKVDIISKEDLARRAEMYVNSAASLYWRGMVGGATSTMMIRWVEGPTIEKCSTCVNMEALGWIPLETFLEIGVYPQSFDLECRGYNCLCSLDMKEKSEITDIANVPKKKPLITITTSRSDSVAEDVRNEVARVKKINGVEAKPDMPKHSGEGSNPDDFADKRIAEFLDEQDDGDKTSAYAVNYGKALHEYVAGEKEKPDRPEGIDPERLNLIENFIFDAHRRWAKSLLGKSDSDTHSDDGHEGKWITLNGSHVFIKNGQTVEQAVDEKFGSEKKHSDASGNDYRQPQTETEAFEKWFGKSKVVDDSGKPIRMYHGSSSDDFNAFNIPSGEYSGGLIYVSTSPKAADYFAGSHDKSRIIPVFVKAENPFDYRKSSDREKIADHVRSGVEEYNKDQRSPISADRLLNNLASPFQGGWEIIENPIVSKAIRDAGFDSVITMERGVENYGVFDPGQLKSAIGNNGNFDPDKKAISDSADESDGKWVTVHGSHIFIKNGEDLGTAFQRTTGTSLSPASSEGSTEKKIATPEQVAYVKKHGAYLPPTSYDVWINPDPDGNKVATWKDKKGKKQYAYTKAYREQQDANKFEKIKHFSDVLPQIKKKTNADLSLNDADKDRAIAAAITLIAETTMRVGGKAGLEDYGTHGASTLLKEHVRVEGNAISLGFVGKHHVEWSREVVNPKLAKAIQHFMSLPGDRLLQYHASNGNVVPISDAMVRTYLKPFDVQPKQFRTYTATKMAHELLYAEPSPSSAKEAKETISRIVAKVAEKLGNTPSVCRSSYINPAILNEYASKVITSQPKAKSDSMSDDEFAEFLKELDKEILSGEVKDEDPFPEETAEADSHTHDEANVRVNVASAGTHTEPSDKQKEYGNYKKGHLLLHGLNISIENPRGSYRRGVSHEGKFWETRLAWPYGYITGKGLSPADGDHPDCFIGPHPESELVFIVNQNDKDGNFDEHKVILGCVTRDQAKEVYLANYSPGWTGLGSITCLTMPQFKDWLENGDLSKPILPGQTSKAFGDSHFSENEFIGVDLDGTLAIQPEDGDYSKIGAPVPAMVQRVLSGIVEGKTFVIFTARVCDDPDDFQKTLITLWCIEHLGIQLGITCIKWPRMIEIWDNRARRCITNTGVLVQE